MARTPDYIDPRDRCAETPRTRSAAVLAELDRDRLAQLSTLAPQRQSVVIDHLAAVWIRRGPGSVKTVIADPAISFPDNSYTAFARFCDAVGIVARCP